VRLVVETLINARRERVFDLARDVDTHVRTSASSCERAVAPGKTTGALELGYVVTFEGKHLGIRQRLTARVVEMDRPVRFVDEQDFAAAFARRWKRRADPRRRSP